MALICLKENCIKKNISFKFFLVLSCNQLLEIKYAKRYALHTVAFAPSSAVTKPFDLPHCFVADTAAPSACFSAPGMTMQSKPVVFIPKECWFHHYYQGLFVLSLNRRFQAISNLSNTETILSSYHQLHSHSTH